MNPTQAIQKPNQNKGTLRAHLESPEFSLQVARVLPKHLTPERFVRVACTALMRVPKLADADEVSFFNSLLTLSQFGLEADGRRAHLVPFWNSKRSVYEVQLIVDYKGLVELVMRSGVVANLHADVVCENDVFEYDRGEVVKHSINFKESRGQPYAAYCVCTFKDGTKKSEAMSKEEIETIRKRSKAAESGPWVTDWNEMAKKTVFRRLSKWLPLSPEVQEAFEADDVQFSPVVDVAAQVKRPDFGQLVPPPAAAPVPVEKVKSPGRPAKAPVETKAAPVAAQDPPAASETNPFDTPAEPETVESAEADQPEPAAEPPAAPERTELAELAVLMKNLGITEEQAVKFCVNKKLNRPDGQPPQWLAELSDERLRNMIKALRVPNSPIAKQMKAL